MSKSSSGLGPESTPSASGAFHQSSRSKAASDGPEARPLRPPSQPRIRIALVECELRSARGVYFMAAKALGISVQALRKRVNNSTRLQRVKAEIDEDITDFARGVVVKGVGEGDPRSVDFWLSTQAKNDWSKRREISGPDAKPVNINWGLDKFNADQIAELARDLGVTAPKSPSQ